MKNRRRVPRAPVFLILLLLVAPALVGQQSEAARTLRLARSLEQSGEWERAAALYESLVQLDPLNYVYFDGLRRAYTRLKKYDQAARLVQQRLRLQPRDPQLLSMLGALYYHQGKSAAADSVWSLVIRYDPTNINGYRVIASQMLEFRLFDRAIELYKEARTVTGDANLFAEELAVMYAALLQYRRATEEYVTMLLRKPQQLSYVQSRLATFTGDSEGLREARSVVEEELKNQPDHVQLRLLMAWILMEANDYESAFQQYREIDALKGTKGVEVFNFAQRALQESRFEVAAHAFKDILDRNPDNAALQPHARFGYARAMEEVRRANPPIDAVAAQTGNEGKEWPVAEAGGGYENVLREYEALVRDFPGSEISAQSLFRIGRIRRDELYDLDGALSAFRQVNEMKVRPEQKEEAAASVGEILVLQNKLDEARRDYEQLAASGRDEMRGRAAYEMARIDYYEGDFDEAARMLDSLSRKRNRDLANDALELLYLINDNVDADREGLQLFARGQLLSRQRKYSEALEQFRLIQTAHPNAPLVDRTTLEQAEVYVSMGEPDNALDDLRTLVLKEASILRDRAQFRIGEIQETIRNDTPKAIEAYETLLVDFPNSIFAGEARKRIRRLRGDTI